LPPITPRKQQGANGGVCTSGASTGENCKLEVKATNTRAGDSGGSVEVIDKNGKRKTLGYHTF
jgi:hypothetical protein